MRGRVFSILAALSTVGLVASLALWCVTREDLYLAQHRSKTGFQVASVRPLGIYLVIGRYLEAPPATGWEFERQRVGAEILGNGRLGFALSTYQQGTDPIQSGQTVQFTRCTFTLVLIPFWAAIASTAVLPTVWWWRFRRRQPKGLCKSCGYDLRGSTGRCPECGRCFEPSEGDLTGDSSRGSLAVSSFAPCVKTQFARALYIHYHRRGACRVERVVSAGRGG